MSDSGKIQRLKIGVSHYLQGMKGPLRAPGRQRYRLQRQEAANQNRLLKRDTCLEFTWRCWTPFGSTDQDLEHAALSPLAGSLCILHGKGLTVTGLLSLTCGDTGLAWQQAQLHEACWRQSGTLHKPAPVTTAILQPQEKGNFLPGKHALAHEVSPSDGGVASPIPVFFFKPNLPHPRRAGD